MSPPQHTAGSNKRLLRILVPLVVMAAAGGVVLTMALAPDRSPPIPESAKPVPALADAGTEAGETPAAETVAPEGTTGEAGAETEEASPEPPVEPGDPATVEGLVAVAPSRGTSGHDTPAAALGSLDPAEVLMEVAFSRAGAGLARIAYSDIWETANARHQAEDGQPDESMRYVLRESSVLRNGYKLKGIEVPMLAAVRLKVGDASVNLFDFNRAEDGDPRFIWAETAPGVFETEVRNAAGETVLRIVRRWTIGEDYELAVTTSLENATTRSLEITWYQYGPGSLRQDRSRYMDRRRCRFGYMQAGSSIVLSDDNDLLIERGKIIKRWGKGEKAIAAGDPAAQSELLRLWPSKQSVEKEYGLSWFAMTNRYFGLAVHPPLNGGTSLANTVNEIRFELSMPDGVETKSEDRVVFTYLISPQHTIGPGETLALDQGVYAGPLDRNVLGKPSYTVLSMKKLILYQMSSFCAFCTFQWLANLLLAFLTLLHEFVLFDWGLGIVGLVLVVRTLLHPITKRSQISMQRFGKQMGEMKPQIDKLQKKFGDDPKRMQQEQMRLMREKGVNPMQMLGCLPMFLQTPIWIALYAMLYFAFDLRQEPAFFGLFQKITGGLWPFLADLSASDHFFGAFDEPIHFLLWNMTGINLLPILMGLIFYVQQKYMSPPPSPTMTPEQQQQQKIMKVMMVVLFPLMLYSAPSGLTLYILTSSCIGVLESRYIRNHIKEMDLKPSQPKAKGKGKAKPKDQQGRAYAAALDRMRQKAKQKKAGPPKTYKKRKG